MMAMDKSELKKGSSAGHDVPAVLQLRSWSSLGLPVSALAKAALSPSRELLLLQTHDREIILFPLGGPSNASPNPLSAASAPDFSFPIPNPQATSPTSPTSPPISASRSVSSIASYAPRDSPPGKNPLLETIPNTAPHPSPLFTPLSTSPNDTQRNESPSSKGSSSKASSSVPTPFLSGVDHFAWASHGDGFGSKGPTGPFKEMLFTSNQEGLSIHCLAAGGRMGVENELSDGNRGLESYEVDAELNGTSAEGLELRFNGPSHSWPSSAEVVSFIIPADSPSFSLVMCMENGDRITPVDARNKGEKEDDPKEGSKSEEPLPTTAGASPDLQGRSEIVDIICNSSHTLVGIVSGQILPEAEMEGILNGQQEERKFRDVRMAKLGIMQNAAVSIALILEWGVKWIAFIDLNRGISKEAGVVPWASFVLASDKFLGLKENGGVFMWAALSGSLIVYIDVVKYCGLVPGAPLGGENSIVDKISRSGDLQKIDAESSPPALLNGEAKALNEDSDGSGGQQQLHQSKRHFTSLAVTANCLLLVVTDSKGLLFLVSTDDYFASKSSQSSTPSLTKTTRCCEEDLKAFSYWEVGGSDIGRSLLTALLPNRQHLTSVDDKKYGDIDTEQTEEKISVGRESGPPARINKWQVVTGFTSKMDVARNGAVSVPSSRARQPIRRVFLPYEHCETLVDLALSSNAITTMVRPAAQNAKTFAITQNLLRIVHGALDERDFYEEVAHKFEGHVQIRGGYIGDVLPFCSQGFLYLLRATSLHIVLPPLAMSGAPSLLGPQEQKKCAGVGLEKQLGWHKMRMSLALQGMVAQQWQTEVLDRALVCDSLEEAELLCVENGWSLQLFYLRRLQLAVDFVQPEDVEHALKALVRVGAAESGVLCVLFAAIELILNQFCSDNELAQASRLLSLAASFTTRLVRQLGVRGWQGSSQPMAPDPSLDSSRYKTSAAIRELARFLEVIRTLQNRLQEKRRGPDSKKGASGRELVRSHGLDVRPLDSIEEGIEEIIAPDVQDLGSGSETKPIVFAGGDTPSLDSSHLGSSPSKALVTTGSSWEVSPTGVEGGKSRRRSHVESPSDMVARWEKDNVDAAGVVRDALKSSGRLALAVAQLHRLRIASGRDGRRNEGLDSKDVFSELLTIGHGIVYELLCKGKTALALAALRRLGEDIEISLRDLAMGVVGRVLHAQAVKELQRLARLSVHDVQLFERVSLIEENYTSSSFWSTYGAQLQGVGADPATTVSSGIEMSLVCDIAGQEGLKIECGEVNGVVLGSWSMIDDPMVVEEGRDVDDSAGYWAAAAVWLQPWDQLTVDRILLERLSLQDREISWEARLEFYVAHHDWPEVVCLLETVPSSVHREGVLHVHLDCEDTHSYNPSLPFSGGLDNTGSLKHSWLDDGETEQVVIPKIQLLQLDLTSICNTLMWQIIEERLVRNLTFCRDHWKGTVELMSLFARAGLLFHPYSWGRNTGSRSRDGSHNLTVAGLIKGSRFDKDAVFGVHELVVQHCLRHTLPHFLELYLDFHSLALDRGSSALIQAIVGDCQWALWLLYSGLPRHEYDSSLANALTISGPSPGAGRSFEFKDIGSNSLPNVNDIAKAGGPIMALSTLMYAPVPIQKCLSVGSISRHEGESWQCSLESIQPGLQDFPTLWTNLAGVSFARHTWGFAYGHPLKAGSRESLLQYLKWHQSLFSCAHGDALLLEMIPRQLPQRVRRLLYLTMQGPSDGGEVGVPKGSEVALEVSSTGNRGSRELKLGSLDTLVSSWEATIEKTIREELQAPSSEDTTGGCEHYIRRGHAVAAFNVLLCSRVHFSKDLKSGHGRLHSSETQALFSTITPHEENILAKMIPLVIMNHENPVVVASFVFLVELCGLSASLLRVDIASLRRISKYLNNDEIESVLGTVGTGSGSNTTDWGSAVGGDVASSLAKSLANEYVHSGIDILSASSEAPQRWSSSKSILTMLQFLEKASLIEEGLKKVEGGSPGAWLLSGQGDGLLLRTMQWSISENWSLVTAFCRAHGLPLCTTYLETLARDNDWVGFLAEAQLEGCPLDVLLNVVSRDFTNARLQSQLLFVLKNLPGASEKPAVVTAKSSPLSSTPVSPEPGVPINAELFSLLADCEGSKRPGKSLLAKAEELRWPLLAVVASCFSDVSAQSCLTTWLEITVVKEASVIETTGAAELISARVGAAVDATNAGAGSDCATGFSFLRKPGNKRLRLSPEEAISLSDGLQAILDEDNAGGNSRRASEAEERATGQKGSRPSEGPTGVGECGQEQDSLAALVAALCEQQRFLPLLRAFELFTPTSSFLPFLRFLQAFSQMRISEASAHLAAFAARLKEEMHQQHFQSRSSKNNTAWISKAAIAAADSMHAACPSAYERRCLLQLLSGSDFGDGGMAAMRFRRLFWKIQLAEPALQEGSDPVTDGAHLDDKALFDTLEESNQWEQARSWARQLDPMHTVSALHRVTETQAEAMVTEWKELLWDLPEERVALWNHCQALFTMHDFPALRAGEFFLKHADAVEPEVSSSELHNILLVALQWLSGSITNSPPVYPLHLLHELETRVWLLAVESSVETRDGGRNSSSLTSMQHTASGRQSHEISVASPIDRTAVTVAVVDSHLKRSSSDVAEVARSWSLDSATSSSHSKPISSKFKQKLKERSQPKSTNIGTLKASEGKSGDSPLNGVQSEVKQKNTGPEAQPGHSDPTPAVTVGGWEDSVGEREVEHAVLALLEVGQVNAAKQLQQKLSLADMPLEVSLVEACHKVASLPPLTGHGSAISSAIPPHVIEYLQTSGLLEDVTKVSPLEMLDVLAEACREGCGRGQCHRISAIARIAGVLDLTFSNAFAKSPTHLLQLLALKGQDSLAEAKLLVATHSIPPASAARILAESFLKGLLAAHRGGYMQSSQKEEGPAPLLWRASDFIRWAQVCPSEPEIGHALMRLVISGRDMPHACEVELIILAYRYYESSACLDGVDVLVALASTRVDSYLSEGDYSSLARLVTGISNFQALHFILDFLIESGQLELLLQKRSAVDSAMESSASIRGFRMAVLSALKHFNPDDLDAFAMVYSNFSMAHEMAALLESRGYRSPEQRSNKQYDPWSNKLYDPEQSEESLEMMRFYVEAAKVYSGIDAGNKTSWCCVQASLICLQLRMPDNNWLNLTETNARRLLVDQTRFQESLIVAEAYGLNQPAEWVPVIWTQMSLVQGRIDQFLNDFVAALPLTHSMLMELARFYRSDVSARGGDANHLDFSKWLTPGANPAETGRHLNKSFRSLLKHTRDMKERLQLATVATGFPDIVDLCLKNIDNMSVTAGPLILRKGHGGTYLPIM